jgi:hypothetical protein
MIVSGVAASGSRNALSAVIVLSAFAYARRSLLTRIPLFALVLLRVVITAWPQITEQVDRAVGSSSVDHRVGALDALGGLLLDRGVLQTSFR